MPWVWNEAYILAVFKIVATYGFTDMQDIGMFVSITKAFTAWAKTNLFMDCACVMLYKDIDANFHTKFQCLNKLLPRPALLKVHKRIVIYRFNLPEPRAKSQMEEFNFTAIKNDKPLLMIRLGREKAKSVRLEFAEKSFLRPLVHLQFSRGPKIRQIKVLAQIV